MCELCSGEEEGTSADLDDIILEELHTEYVDHRKCKVGSNLHVTRYSLAFSQRTARSPKLFLPSCTRALWVHTHHRVLSTVARKVGLINPPLLVFTWPPRFAANCKALCLYSSPTFAVLLPARPTLYLIVLLPVSYCPISCCIFFIP